MMENDFKFTSAAISDRGLSEKRPQNEDSYLELKPHGIFAVADGVGGAQAGDVASQMAVEIIGEAFVNLSPEADPEETMKLAIERANEAIFQMSHDLPQLSSMATTVVALHVARDIATIAHVGDSRLYRVDATGQLFRETADHSVVEEEVRAGRMTPEQAVNHPSRNVISRALGAESDVDIDLKMQIIHPSTTFLLCSDGITRHIDDWEIAALLASDSEPSVICQQMKQICFDRGAEDNLTAVIIRFPAENVESASPSAFHRQLEPEEVTHAAVRPIPTEQQVAPHQSVNETPAPELVTPLEPVTDDGDEAFLLQDASELYSDEPAAENLAEYTSSSVIVPAITPPVEKRDAPVFTQNSIYSDEPVNETSVLSKMLSSLVLLVVGALLGIAGYYFLLRPQPAVIVETPVITEQKSNNTSLTAFEEGRRQVDSDPAKYIAAEAASPEVPEDYFLLGRAFFLTGKQWEAKKSFNEAKNRLAQADPMNAKTLSTEISMALAILDNAQASEAFSKQISTNGSAPVANTISNIAPVNANVSPNANTMP